MNMIGKLIDGRYEIIEEIGKGGMARVYKSRDKALNRYVAVKILKEDYKDDKEFVRRFNTEAQAAASLSNPHIVSIYDVGCEDGMYYIVMEYIEGETLKSYIDRVGVIQWRKAAEFSLQICEGIEEAHNNSVIHRDIKPQNIIMTPDGVLKITDFGIARAATQATTTMASNNTIGTAHYLSPEQARGGYTDERTDIYSMGVVMYEMLTGVLPFDDSTAVAIALKHIQETPTPITEINPDVPKSLEQVVMKAMTKEQNSRYSSITDMISDINKVLIDPGLEITGGRRNRTISSDGGANTIKLPKIEEDNSLGKRIPGIDIDDYDEQEAEYEAMERLNEKRARRIKKKKERKIAFVAFLSALAVLAAGIAISFAVTDGFGIFGTDEDTVKIPSLVGTTLKDAQKEYGQTFSILEQSKTESTQPVGTILEQTPAGGTVLANRDNIIIRVITSSGSSSITLKDYSGMNYDDAKKELEKLGLTCGRIEKVNPEIAENVVFEQSPAPGSAVAAGDMINLTVSSGPEKTPEPTTAKSENKNTSSSGSPDRDYSESSSGGSSGRDNPESSSSGSSSSSESSSGSGSSHDDDSGSSSLGSGSSSGGSSHDDGGSSSSGGGSSESGGGSEDSGGSESITAEGLED